MPQKKTCCCPRHGEWCHVDDAPHRVATAGEKDICIIDPDGRHRDRKRYICAHCRKRILLEGRIGQFEVRLLEVLRQQSTATFSITFGFVTYVIRKATFMSFWADFWPLLHLEKS